MATNIPADSSPERLLRLLWHRSSQQRSHPGPRPRITVKEIIETAVACADAGGLAALTMRKLAEELGVKPMSIYSHVPDKASLLALMTDHVHALSARQLPRTTAWRERVRGVVEDTYRLHLSHPWLNELRTEQPPLGPGILGRYERQLEALLVLDLPDLTMDATLNFITDFARSAATDTLRRRHQTMTGNQWWATVSPVLTDLATAQNYPLATRIGTTAGHARGGAYNAEAAYAFGLERVLDAVAALLEHPARSSQEQQMDLEPRRS